MNISEILASVGLNLTEEQSNQVGEAIGQHYKTVAEWNEQASALEAANLKISTTEEALKRFEGVDVDALKGEISTLKENLSKADEAHAAQLAEIQFNSRLETAIKDMKGRNAKAVRALLDEAVLKASKNQDADIKAALEAVKAENGYLFEEEKQIPPPYSNSGSSGSGGASYNDRMRAVMGLPPKKD